MSSETLADLRKNLSNGVVEWPELMMFVLQIRGQNGVRVLDGDGGLHYGRLSGKTKERELREQAGRPTLAAIVQEPFVRGVMMRVARPRESEEYVYVQQRGGHLNKTVPEIRWTIPGLPRPMRLLLPLTRTMAPVHSK